jgi:hypothetical protein
VIRAWCVPERLSTFVDAVLLFTVAGEESHHITITRTTPLFLTREDIAYLSLKPGTTWGKTY